MEHVGNGFQLRLFQPEDAEDVARGIGNPKVWRNLGDHVPQPYAAEHFTEWHERMEQDDGKLNWAIDIGGQAAGAVGLVAGGGVYRRKMTLGYWLAEEYWGRGIVTEAVGLVLRQAFADENIERVEAIVFGWNPASGRVLEKNGFTLEGRLRDGIFKDGAYTDCLHYGILRSDFASVRGE